MNLQYKSAPDGHRISTFNVIHVLGHQMNTKRSSGTRETLSIAMLHTRCYTGTFGKLKSKNTMQLQINITNKIYSYYFPR